jgi:hypothetical protein
MEFNTDQLTKFLRTNKLGITGDVPYINMIDSSEHQTREAALQSARECLRLIGRDPSCRLTDAQNLYANL